MAEPFRVDSVRVEGRSALRLARADGALSAVVVPELAMLGASLQRDGLELLGLRGGVAAYAERGSTMGIPLLYPWANRLADLRAAGVQVGEGSPLVRRDGATGLAIHGLRLTGAPWRVSRRVADAEGAEVAAELDWEDDPGLMAAFPIPHRLEVSYRLDHQALHVGVVIQATGEAAVPLAFGFHPYLAPPGAPRAQWGLALPVGPRFELDDRGLPTGRSLPGGPIDGPLGERVFDDLFRAPEAGRTMAVEGGGQRVELSFGPGFPFAQIFAPPTEQLIAIEPMTAPTDALSRGGPDLRTVPPGRSFGAGFSIQVP